MPQHILLAESGESAGTAFGHFIAPGVMALIVVGVIFLLTRLRRRNR